MAMAATAALVPCLGHRLVFSPLSPIPQQQQSDRASTQQQLIWGRLSPSIKRSFENRKCFCSTRDESFTSMGNVTLFDDQASDLEGFIANVKDKLVVLDISTKTCGPCKFIFPKLVKLSEDYPDVVFLKINGDHDSDTRALMRKWKVRAVPTFKFFRNGKNIHTHSGAKEDDLRANFMVHYHSETVSI